VVEPYPSEKNDEVKVSWDDYSIPSMMGKSFKIPWFTTNQMIIWWFPEIEKPQSSNSLDFKLVSMVT